jgi:hypothetical protein
MFKTMFMFAFKFIIMLNVQGQTNLRYNTMFMDTI